MRQPTRRRTPRGKLRGIALLEALIGVLIFSFGVLGLVGLQVSMSRAQGSAKYRADAAYLGSQVFGLIWADRPNLAQYDTAGNCAGHAPCADWLAKVAASLPEGNARIAATPATGVVTLTITWSTSAEGTRSHVLSTSIR